MAPELFRQNRGDALLDQYALGVTVYRMLPGNHTFGETPPGERPLFAPVPPLSAYRDDVPAWLNAAVLRAISLHRDDRFGDVEEFIFALTDSRKSSRGTAGVGSRSSNETHCSSGRCFARS